MKRQQTTNLFMILIGILGLFGLYILGQVIPTLWEGYLVHIDIWGGRQSVMIFAILSGIPYFGALYQVFHLARAYSKREIIDALTPSRLRYIALFAFIEFILYFGIAAGSMILRIRLPFEAVFFIASVLLIALFLSVAFFILAAVIQEAYDIKREGELTI